MEDLTPCPPQHETSADGTILFGGRLPYRPQQPSITGLYRHVDLIYEEKLSPSLVTLVECSNSHIVSQFFLPFLTCVPENGQESYVKR
jgi:hypothetical protein